MEEFDLGKAAEWARKVAQKLEKNGRLVLMAGMFGPSGHFYSRMRVEVVGVWKGGGDVDRHNCAPVEWCVDNNVSSAARCTEWKKLKRAQGRSCMYERRITECGQKRIPKSIENRQSTWSCCNMRGPPDFVGLPFSFTYDTL
jgi:hypothetical protein